VQHLLQGGSVAAQLQPDFLVAWVRAELEADGNAARLGPLIERALNEGLSEAEGELDACGQIAERHGWLDALERATGELILSEVREVRAGGERLERSGGGAVVAFLQPAAGAVARLSQLAAALQAEPGASVAELPSHLGGSPGCSTR
jgi:hypothetical protein